MHFINILRPRQNGRHFADDILKCILLNENVWILNQILLKFVPQGPINNIPALIQIMAWYRPGDKPLSGPIRVRLPTHICITWPQWVKCHWPSCGAASDEHFFNIMAFPFHCVKILPYHCRGHLVIETCITRKQHTSFITCMHNFVTHAKYDWSWYFIISLVYGVPSTLCHYQSTSSLQYE